MALCDAPKSLGAGVLPVDHGRPSRVIQNYGSGYLDDWYGGNEDGHRDQMEENLNRTMKAALPALFIAMLMSSNSWAADKDGAYVSFGVGTSSCTGWTTARAADDVRTVQYQEWLLGYISAYNNWVHKGQNVAGNMDKKGIFAWINNYCRENGADLLAQAAENLMLDLKGGKVKGGKK